MDLQRKLLDAYDAHVSDLLEQVGRPRSWLSPQYRDNVRDALQDMQTLLQFVQEMRQAEKDGNVIWLTDLSKDKE